MQNFRSWFFIEEANLPIEIGQFEGSPQDEFQAANLFQNHQKIGRIEFGMHKTFQGVQNQQLVYDYYGTIDDVYLSVRGTNAMRSIYPQIENRLKVGGAKRIKLKTTNNQVGIKVWQPLGFKPVGQYNSGVHIWEKIL